MQLPAAGWHWLECRGTRSSCFEKLCYFMSAGAVWVFLPFLPVGVSVDITRRALLRHPHSISEDPHIWHGLFNHLKLYSDTWAIMVSVNMVFAAVFEPRHPQSLSCKLNEPLKCLKHFFLLYLFIYFSPGCISVSRKKYLALAVWCKLSSRHSSSGGGRCLLYRNLFFLTFPQILGGVSALFCERVKVHNHGASHQNSLHPLTEVSWNLENGVVGNQLGKYLQDSCWQRISLVAVQVSYCFFCSTAGWTSSEDLGSLSSLWKWEFTFWILDLLGWIPPAHCFWPSALVRGEAVFLFASI